MSNILPKSSHWRKKSPPPYNIYFTTSLWFLSSPTATHSSTSLLFLTSTHQLRFVEEEKRKKKEGMD